MPLAEDSRWPLLRRGEGATPILLLHGFMGRKEDWLPLIDTMGTGYAYMAPDLPGHGENTAMDEVPEYPDIMSGLESLRTGLGIARWHLAGYSMGGRFALAYALVYPERVASLTMISSGPGIAESGERAARRDRDEVWAERLELDEPGVLLADWYRQPVFRTLERNPVLLSELLATRGSGPMRLYADALRKWGQGVMPSAWGRLSTLEVPSCWIAGLEDPAYVQSNRRAAECVSRSTCREIEGAGHAVHLEKPRDLGHSITQFWNNIRHSNEGTA